MHDLTDFVNKITDIRFFPFWDIISRSQINVFLVKDHYH